MDLYREEVMEHYEHPRNRGELKGVDVITAHEHNASCGDMVQFFVKIERVKSKDKSEKPIITEVKWEGTGCAIMTASASKLSEYLQNQNLEDLQKMSEEQLAKIGVGFEVNAGRSKCLRLPITVTKKLLQN